MSFPGTSPPIPAGDADRAASSSPPSGRRILVVWECCGPVCEALIDARSIPGFPGYLVTKDGDVLTCRKNFGERSYYNRMRPSTDAKGYLGLTLCGPEKTRRKVRVHRLVAEVFLLNPENMPCVRHIDGNSKNNRAENLAWATYAENEADKRVHGTWETRRNGKLSEDDRKTARLMRANGASQAEIAAHLGVSRPAITRLLNGSTWA